MIETRPEDVKTKIEMRKMIEKQMPTYLAAGGQIQRIQHMSADERIARHKKQSFYGREASERRPPTKIHESITRHGGTECQLKP